MKKNSSFEDFLKSGKVKIDTYSLETKLKLRNKNTVDTIFKKSKDRYITAAIVGVNGDDKKGTLDVEIMMNKVKKVIKMPYKVVNGLFSANGGIDLVDDFDMGGPFAAFAKKCKGVHGGKSYSEVGLNFNFKIS